jgi:hypothetical protein
MFMISIPRFISLYSLSALVYLLRIRGNSHLYTPTGSGLHATPSSTRHRLILLLSLRV